MPKACEGVMKDLAKCIADSKCIQEDMLSIEECVKRAEECSALRYTYSECKRGQVNMRTRIQGKKGY
ncbi:cytochrome c oxidase assembly protein [Chloropicon primus]|uniref:Cytochrome c oxidase assembly protein n=1 Tax=Chloropicon primus TaxID=1764295 RepID=A0A5B8MJX3_9CHLO|nr:cytochrome c oxidase assembly protein [Chloropicon primus]UPQ99206.1 cytochrome c oxidase assembly protein [Chloropicon primus]|eukprot:QDZ19995.1 cytochrome c oxidase assembly protein [Chloropicon primus]